jgi:pyrroline-5-carboxylate reductase
MTVKLVVFGGGNMGSALIGGLLAQQWCAPQEMLVIEPNDSLRGAFQQGYSGLSLSATPPSGVTADAAIIAVKPQYVAGVCAMLPALGVKRVLSVAAGITTEAIEAAAGGAVAVVRSMPNTPALVGKGAAAITAGKYATKDDMAWALSILSAVGTVVTVTEPLMDAVTGLSGSGPAYLFLVAEALIEGGVLSGLPRPTARQLVAQLFAGAGEMLTQGDEPAVHRAAVTSPGGTTAAGLRELERAGVRSAMIEAVAAATARSRQLG